MAYVTERQLEDKIDVPIQLPATKLLDGDALIVTSIHVPNDALVTLSLRFLQLRLLEVAAQEDCTVPEDVSVKLGLFKGYNFQTDPESQAVLAEERILEVIPPSPSLDQRDYQTVLTISDPGTYSWVVWSSTEARVTVSG